MATADNPKAPHGCEPGAYHGDDPLRYAWEIPDVPGSLGPLDLSVLRVSENVAETLRRSQDALIAGTVRDLQSSAELTAKYLEVQSGFRCWVKRNRHLLAFWFGVAEVVLLVVIVGLEWVRR